MNLAIRDRGKMKWQGAFFMPEHVKMLGNLRTDYHRIIKPQLDNYQFEEFNEVVSEAMAENKPIKITIWQDGFTLDKSGYVHYVDLLTQQLRIEVQPGEYECVKMVDIIKVIFS